MKLSFLILYATFFVALQSAFSYDIFELWVQWPNSICTFSTCKSGYVSPNTPPQSFTIHGLWPTYNNGTPASANTAYELTEAQLQTQLATITTSLDQHWPSLLPSNTNLGFWRHEWNKHGTASYSELKPALNYFNKTLGLRSSNDLLQILKQRNVTATDKKTYDLYTTLDAAIGTNKFFIQCRSKKVQGTTTYFVMQVAMCFNKSTFGVTTCNAQKVSNYKSKCGTSILLPNTTTV